MMHHLVVTWEGFGERREGGGGFWSVLSMLGALNLGHVFGV